MINSRVSTGFTRGEHAKSRYADLGQGTEEQEYIDRKVFKPEREYITILLDFQLEKLEMKQTEARTKHQAVK